MSVRARVSDLLAWWPEANGRDAMCDSSRGALLLYSPSVPREGAHVLGCFEEEISPHETGQRRPKVRPQHHPAIAPHTTRLRLYRPHACANIFLSCAIACVRRAQATGTIDSTTTITNADVPIVTATTPMGVRCPSRSLAHGHHEPTQAAPLRAGQIRHIRHRGGRSACVSGSCVGACGGCTS